MCVLQVLGKVKQPAKFQRHSSMHHAVMPTSVFAVGFLLCVPKTVFFGFYEGEDVKNAVF